MRRFTITKKDEPEFILYGVEYPDGYVALRAQENALMLQVRTDIWSEVQNTLFGDEAFLVKLVD